VSLGCLASRLEPDPGTAPVVRRMSGQWLAGHPVARIARALNEAGIPCPSAAGPGRNRHRTGAAWTLRTVASILSNPRYTGWVISARPAHPALVSEDDFIAAQDISATRSPDPQDEPAVPLRRRYLLAGRRSVRHPVNSLSISRSPNGALWSCAE
jgi:site-specific DNA recombinase